MMERGKGKGYYGTTVVLGAVWDDGKGAGLGRYYEGIYRLLYILGEYRPFLLVLDPIRERPLSLLAGQPYTSTLVPVQKCNDISRHCNGIGANVITFPDVFSCYLMCSILRYRRYCRKLARKPHDALHTSPRFSSRLSIRLFP